MKEIQDRAYKLFKDFGHEEHIGDDTFLRVDFEKLAKHVLKGELEAKRIILKRILPYEKGCFSHREIITVINSEMKKCEAQLKTLEDKK